MVTISPSMKKGKNSTMYNRYKGSAWKCESATMVPLFSWIFMSVLTERRVDCRDVYHRVLFHFAEPWSLHGLRFHSFVSFQAIPSPSPSPNRILIHLIISRHPSTFSSTEPNENVRCSTGTW